MAANPGVRDEMRRRQREWAEQARRRGDGGPRHRHGRVPRRRAQGVPRRLARGAGQPAVQGGRAELDYETVATDLARRDALDQGREHAPLREADRRRRDRHQRPHRRRDRRCRARSAGRLGWRRRRRRTTSRSNASSSHELRRGDDAGPAALVPRPARRVHRHRPHLLPGSACGGPRTCRPPGRSSWRPCTAPTSTRPSSRSSPSAGCATWARPRCGSRSSAPGSSAAPAASRSSVGTPTARRCGRARRCWPVASRWCCSPRAPARRGPIVRGVPRRRRLPVAQDRRADRAGRPRGHGRGHGQGREDGVAGDDDLRRRHADLPDAHARGRAGLAPGRRASSPRS